MTSRIPLRRRFAALVTGVTAAAALVAAGTPAAHAADTPLRDLAAAKGKVIGTAVPADSAKLAQQAADCKSVVSACAAVTRCAGVTVWGFTDSDSWVPSTFPGYGAATPYDDNYAPKPACNGIAEALGGGSTTPPPTNGACTAAYSVTSQWNTGFTGQVKITCSGASLSSWKATWTYGAGQRITQAWNATCTQSGAAVTCANASYNGSAPDGGSVTFGFNGSWSGSNPVPAVTLG